MDLRVPVRESLIVSFRVGDECLLWSHYLRQLGCLPALSTGSADPGWSRHLAGYLCSLRADTLLGCLEKALSGRGPEAHYDTYSPYKGEKVTFLGQRTKISVSVL